MARNVRLENRLHLASRLALLVTLALALAGPSGANASTHPFNETRAEVALNPESGDLEVALGFDALALEEVLTRCDVSPASARDATEAGGSSEPVEEYVRARFGVEQAGERRPLRWLGHEVEHSSVWVYFEVELEGPLAGSRWINELLFELADPDPLNLVILREGEQTHRWVHRRNEPEYRWQRSEAERQRSFAAWSTECRQLVGRTLERAVRRALGSTAAADRRYVRDGAVALAVLLGDAERLATVTTLAAAPTADTPDASEQPVPQSDLRTLLGYASWLAAGSGRS